MNAVEYCLLHGLKLAGPEHPAILCAQESLSYGALAARLSDLKAKLEQLAMDARRSPQRIFRAHPPDQRAQIRVDLRSTSKRAGFPTPVPTEAGPMPTHEGLGPNDRDSLQDRWKPSIQLDQEQAIPICELDATPYPALQHNQLMTQRRVLGLKSALRLERRDGQGQEEARRARSSPLTLGDSVTQSIRM